MDEDDAADLVADRPRIAAGLSITNAALVLFHHLGARQMEVWGLDCCVAQDGTHHAAGADGPGGPYQPIRVEERMFQSSATWAAEAQQFLPHLHAIDATVTVHGDGMLAATLRALAHRHGAPAAVGKPA